MPTHEFEALEALFDEIVAIMPKQFDSHEFILRLAQQHQQPYVEALAAYATTGRPFQIVHGKIARRLMKRPDLVTKIGEHDSPDIFGQVCSVAIWRKTKNV